jgi:hypothetical protein
VALNLNMLRNKTVGPAPAGPLGGKAKSRAAGFVAGRNFGLSKDKKASAGARAGIGRAGRGKPRRIATVGTGVTPPRGPAGSGLTANPSVRLPNRSKPQSSSSSSTSGFLGSFFKRFRKG